MRRAGVVLAAFGLLVGSGCGGEAEPEPAMVADTVSGPMGMDPIPPPVDEPALEPEPAEPPADRTPPAQRTPPPPAASQPPPRAPAEQQRITGRVVVTGSTPTTFVTLQREEGPPVQLSGALEPELRRLSGAVVAVDGTLAPGGLRGGSMEVLGYEVISIDGQRPHVGTLRAIGDGYTLVGDDTLRLDGVPASLAERDGAKVWIVGPTQDGVLRIQSFGVIRP